MSNTAADATEQSLADPNGAILRAMVRAVLRVHLRRLNVEETPERDRLLWLIQSEEALEAAIEVFQVTRAPFGYTGLLAWIIANWQTVLQILLLLLALMERIDAHMQRAACQNGGCQSGISK